MTGDTGTASSFSPLLAGSGDGKGLLLFTCLLVGVCVEK